MGKLPNVFMEVGEGAIASYDYTDIAEGTGVVAFYGVGQKTNPGGRTLSLMSNAVGAAGTATEMMIGGAAGVETLHTFNAAPFNLPKIVKGTAYLSADLKRISSNPLYASGSSIYKVTPDGETLISTVVNSQNITTASTTEHILLPMTLTQTHFKKGDYLRFKVYISPAETTEGISINPTSATYIPMKLLIPFKLDL